MLFGIDCDVRIKEWRLQKRELVCTGVCPGEIASGKIRGLGKTAWLETGDEIEQICTLNNGDDFGNGKIESGKGLEERREKVRVRSVNQFSERDEGGRRNIAEA